MNFFVHYVHRNPALIAVDGDLFTFSEKTHYDFNNPKEEEGRIES